METSIEGILSVSMYSIRELDDPLRRDFELPGDPYDSNTEIANRGKKYLADLGIFFWRDELHDEGIIIEEADDDPTPFVNRHNLHVYASSASFNFETLTPKSWESPTAEVLSKWPDGNMWLQWNNEHNLIEMTEKYLRLS